jgi:SnoaL-like domain
MKNFIFLVLILLLSSVYAQNVDLAETMAEVKSVVDQYTQALETEDIVLLSKITAHDADMVTFGTHVGERVIGWIALQELLNTQFENTETTKITVSDQVIKISNSLEVGWFSEIIDWTLVVEDQEVKLSGLRVTGVLENRDGNWVFVQLHYSIPAVD